MAGGGAAEAQEEGRPPGTARESDGACFGTRESGQERQRSEGGGAGCVGGTWEGGASRAEGAEGIRTRGGKQEGDVATRSAS